MELKLAQELASVNQDPILLVSLDLGKAYDNLDRGRLLQTLEGGALQQPTESSEEMEDGRKGDGGDGGINKSTSYDI